LRAQDHLYPRDRLIRRGGGGLVATWILLPFWFVSFIGFGILGIQLRGTVLVLIPIAYVVVSGTGDPDTTQIAAITEQKMVEARQNNSSGLQPGKNNNNTDLPIDPQANIGVVPWSVRSTCVVRTSGDDLAKYSFTMSMTIPRLLAIHKRRFELQRRQQTDFVSNCGSVWHGLLRCLLS
jgi:hypothetical protein